jgi:hypothetical protein
VDGYDVWLVSDAGVIEDVGNFPGQPPRWLKRLDGQPAERALNLAGDEIKDRLARAARVQLEQAEADRQAGRTKRDGLAIKVVG